jgi:hypothetical protein
VAARLDLLLDGRVINARHAGVRLLVGWYLIIPPLAPNGRAIDAVAPLASWLKSNQPFATKEECENAKARLIALHPHPSGPHERLTLEGEEASLCIPTDDPRLYYKITPLSVSN